MSASYNCDRCHRPIADGNRTAIKAKAGPLKARGELDLCGPCAAELADWLDGRPKPRARRSGRAGDGGTAP